MQLPCLIFIVIAASCNGTTLKTEQNDTIDIALKNRIKKSVPNIKTSMHGKHPSIAEQIQGVATCIIDEAYDEAMEEIVIQSYHGLKSNETVKVRNAICKEHKEIINTFIFCLIHAQTEEFRDFLTALSITAEFIIEELCKAPEDSQFQKFIDKTKWRQSVDDDVCLPAEVADSIEVMAILSRKLPFQLHGTIGHLYYLVTIIVFDNPLKAYRECD